MFGWFKKEKPADDAAAAVVDKFLNPSALAVALAETIAEYNAEVHSGRIESPAHKRENDGVVGIWADLRLETLSRLFGFGCSNSMLLADPREQLNVLSCLLDDRPHLGPTQPRGVPIPDTLQAVWQVYLYLSKVGSEVGDPKTADFMLEPGQSPFDDLISRAEKLRANWETFHTALNTKGGRLPEMPGTLLEELYEDVTEKTKSIALSAKLGPSHAAGLKSMERLVRQAGGNTVRLRAMYERIMRAKDPHELATVE